MENSPVAILTMKLLKAEQQRDDLLSIVKDMRNAKSEVFSMSPEGRKYLAKMDAAIAKCET